MIRRLIDAAATASVGAVHAAGTSGLLARATGEGASQFEHGATDLIPHTRLSLLNSRRLSLPESALSSDRPSMSTSWSSMAGVGIVCACRSVGSRSWVTVLRCDQRSFGGSTTGAWRAGSVAAAETLHEGWAGGGAVGVGCGLGVVGAGAEHFE